MKKIDTEKVKENVGRIKKILLAIKDRWSKIPYKKEVIIACSVALNIFFFLRYFSCR